MAGAEALEPGDHLGQTQRRLAVLRRSATSDAWGYAAIRSARRGFAFSPPDAHRAVSEWVGAWSHC